MNNAQRRVNRIARAEKMAVSYRAGLTLQQIGDEHGITRERVRQLISAIGVRWTDGGIHLQAVKTAAARTADLNERTVKKWGISRAEWLEICETYGSSANNSKNPFCAFWMQRRSAKQRGIGWEITFPQWWGIWQGSGKWELRGPGKGYCMARVGDRGPYRPDNVYICTIGKNFSDSYITKPWATRFPNGHPVHLLQRQTRRSRPSGPRGYTVIHKGSRTYYQVVVCKKYIGSFRTPEQARAAYERVWQERLAA